MKIAFFSNFLNHHQLPFCEAMCRLTDGQFTFVATTPIPKERLDFGYADMNCAYPFVLRAYEGEEEKQNALTLALNADVVIHGSAPEKYRELRLKHGKLTFCYSERIYKKGYEAWKWPVRLLRFFWKYGRHKNLYMLCASAYTAGDFGKTLTFLGKTYRWAYFPEVKKQNLDTLFARKKKKNTVSILWVGRLIKWKHPEAAIHLAEHLRSGGHTFELNIIGSGEMEQWLTGEIASKNLGDCVHMLGSMSPEQVRDHMENADIFLFTSDFNEGWGAVLNESMNSGCAVVASHAIGSVGFLLDNSENGIVYHNGDQDSLNEAVVSLLNNPELRERMGRAAYNTLAKEWNADVAAERFLGLCRALSNGEKTPYLTGPCSVAERISNRQAGERLKKTTK